MLDGDDQFPLDDSEQTDTDGDGFGDNSDNCVEDANPAQDDLDEDDIGDVCDLDDDGDGVLDAEDNCPTLVDAVRRIRMAMAGRPLRYG